MKKKQNWVPKHSSPSAAYKNGMDLYLKKGDPDAALKFLIKAAKAGYTKAYGEIGIIFHREKNEPDKAEEWFIKAEETDSLFPAARYEYGMLHYLSKDDWKTGLEYLLGSANQGYELAYGDIGSITIFIKKILMKQKNGSKRQNNQIASWLQLHMITECCYGWAKTIGEKALNISKNRRKKDLNPLMVNLVLYSILKN